MVVEDEAITAMDIKRTLEMLGFEVVSTASRGKEAIQKAEELKPDLVLMDIVLKGDMDGIEAADNVMKLLDIPVVYLTAHSDNKTFERAKLTEPYGFITKPINHEGLKVSIETAIYKHSLDKKLGESETRFRSLYENSFDAILLTKPDGTILAANPAAQKMFLMSEEEITKAGRAGLVIENKQLESALEERTRKGKTKAELTYKRKNGSTFIGETTSGLFTDADGVVKTSMIIRDITERKQTEAKLHKSEKKFKSLYSSITEGVAIHKVLYDSSHEAVDYVITDVNPAYEDITGLKRREIIGKRASVIYGIGKPPYIDIYSRVAESGESTQFEAYFEPMAKHFRIAVTSPSKGKFATFFDDITERKKAEEALRQARDNLELEVQRRTKELEKINERLSASEAQFRTLSENSPNLIMRLDKDLRYVYINPQVTGFTGQSQEYYIGKTYEEAGIPEKIATIWKESNLNAFETGNIQCQEFEFPAINGLKFVESTVVPEFNVDGEIESLLILSRDITQIKETEKQLKEAINELEYSNKELQSFAYITSHDLQEPLRTIASFTQLLQHRYENKLDSDADEFMDYIVNASVRMKEMIQSLLEYSHIDRVGTEFIKTDMNNMLEKAISNLYYAIEESDAEITHDNLPIVIANPDQMVSIFQNFISNAIKFKKPEIPPKIYISAKLGNKGEYIFSVSDNGIGMEPQYTNKIFEVFKRLHTIDEYNGAGIGLAIIKRIIDSHGGRVWVESELGVGSTFYFTLMKP